MADATKIIGSGVCPVCRNGKARFSVSKSNLVCMTCNGCNCQIFARSDNSDERLRANIHGKAEAPADAPAAAPTMAPPAGKALGLTTPPPAPKNAPPPAQAAPAGRGFGMLGNWL